MQTMTEKRGRVAFITTPKFREQNSDEIPEEEPLRIAKSSVASGPGPGVRNSRIAVRLQKLLDELSGLDFHGMNGDTPFTEAGLDSLALTQVSVAIEKQLGVRLAFRQLLEEFPTLNALADHLERTLPPDTPPAAEEPKLIPAGRTCDAAADTMVLPLTDAQREIWFASQVSDAASCVFNECRLLHLRGPLEPESMIGALRKLVARHEALRTTFAASGAAQHIHRELTLDVPTMDWSGLAEAGQELRREALLQEEARQPFDLVNGPLVRARLIHLGEQHHLLLWTVHHLVCDGHSLGIVLRELGELYSAGRRRIPEPLPPPLQLSEYAGKVAAKKSDGEYAAGESYWLAQFAGEAPALELPTDGPRPAAWRFEGARETRGLPATLNEAVKRFNSRQGCTPFASLLAVYVLWLHRLTGQDEMTVGIPTADRALDGGDSLVAHCINFLPLRCRINGDLDFAGFLTEVKQAFWEAFEHRQFGFGNLLHQLNVPRDQSRRPLVQATFNVERLKDGLKFSGRARSP